MCGITGVVKSTLITADDKLAVHRSAAAMAHRGPDGIGEYLDTSGQHPKLYMAMRRLSIIDLRNGWQPLTNEDASIAVIANGEIYNHVELRAELVARGHVLKTGSDCEVLVHLYEDYGLDFVHRLRGMFAFALWDSVNRRLVLGRDRLGEKPLYICETPGAVSFASEMKSILAMKAISLSLDPAMIHSYLQYGWVADPGATVVRGVRMLPPAHLLVIDVETWSRQEMRYWRIEDAPPLQSDPTELLRSELDRIGALIIRSDVPVGIALSGGIDSSLAASIAVRHQAGELAAFSVGYESQDGHDERPAARRLAHDLGLPFHSVEVSISEAVEAFPSVAFCRDDPIADIAGYGYFVLSQQARAKGYPVLLQGQGGDELFWGYPWVAQAVEHSLRKAQGSPVGVWEALWANRPKGFSRPELVRAAYFFGGLLAGWRKLSPGLHSPPNQLVAYDLGDSYQIASRGIFSTYTREFAARVSAEASDSHALFTFGTDGTPVDIQIMSALCRGYLLQNGIAQGDRLSMANSVELRLPLVDYRLAEIAVGLQKTKPMYSSPPKAALREAAKSFLPSYVFERPKRGFNPPVVQWLAALRTRFGPDLRNGLLVEEGLLDPAAAATLCESTWRFGTGNDMFLKYLVLEFWYRGMQGIARG